MKLFKNNFFLKKPKRKNEKKIKFFNNKPPLPLLRRHTDISPSFTTLWCRSIQIQLGRHQAQIRDYPKCFMDFCKWNIRGKFCGAEQKGGATAQRVGESSDL